MKDLLEILAENGYTDIRQLPDGSWAGLMHYLFTTAIVVGLDSTGYSHRYCFEVRHEAGESFDKWDGIGDPPGNWIKRKGSTGDFSNPNYKGKSL